MILVSPLRRSVLFGKPWTLPAGLALFALSYVIQATAGTTSAILAGRWIMGLGMTTCLFALNAETARLTRIENAGQSFGALDSAGKWAGVAAGVLAGVATGMSNQTAPFWLGAGVTLLTITLSVYRSRSPATEHQEHLDKE